MRNGGFLGRWAVCLGVAASVGAWAVSAAADVVTVGTPSLDRWMYPFNSTPGSRTTAGTFGAVGEPGFDDRDAQFLIGFGTGGPVPAGLGAGNYAVSSVVLTATVATPNTFVYDPTFDAADTYRAGGAVDGDAGRPIELFGVGYRNGFTRATFAENTAFAPPGPPAEGVRSAFAADYSGGSAVDVSNNVGGVGSTPGFDATPWAVGTTSLAPGETVPAGTTVSFALNLADPDVMAYVQEGLDAGELRFSVTSLHEATFGGSPSYPIFFTKENTTASAAPATLTVTLVPEPGSAGLAVVAAAAALCRRRRRS